MEEMVRGRTIINCVGGCVGQRGTPTVEAPNWKCLCDPVGRPHGGWRFDAAVPLPVATSQLTASQRSDTG